MENNFYCEKLPNPLIKRDGTPVKNAMEWEQQKAYLRSVAEEHMYGPWPGKADSVKGEVLETTELFDGKAIKEKVLLTVDYRGTVFTMDVRITRPNDEARHPVVIANAMMHDSTKMGYNYEPAVAQRGYAIVSFLTGDIVPDVQMVKYFNLPFDENKVFPKLPCRTIMAWGWGHSVVADYVFTRSFAGELITTGASRGGKAALCAAIFDQRFAVAGPTIAGCGGTGTARFCGTIDGSRQDSVRSETIGRITEVFPDWFNDVYASYGSHEEPFAIDEKTYRFPLDANVLRAMVAPRAVTSSDGLEDHWSNTFGTQLAWMAAQPVFDFLGVPQNNGLNFRPGGHGLFQEDLDSLIAFCDRVLGRSCEPYESLNQPYYTDIEIKDYCE